MKLIKQNCYNCHSMDSEYYDSENGFVLVKCKNCGLVYVNPRPANEDISKAALTGMHEGEKKKNATGRYSRSQIKRYLKILKDFYPNDIFNQNSLSWLDIGCGFGEFMEALEKYSDQKLSIRGSEPNKCKINSALKRNLNVSFIDLDEHNEQYDFISLLNVFSHLPDPIKFLSNLKKRLNPGGELFLETGHTSHLPPKCHNKPYNLPDHLHFANKEILEGILRKIGFEIIDTKIYRSTLFPKIYEVKSVIKTIAKIVLRRGRTIHNLFPKYANIDMYIRSKLIV